jgi:hypothetical protein
MVHFEPNQPPPPDYPSSWGPPGQGQAPQIVIFEPSSRDSLSVHYGSTGVQAEGYFAIIAVVMIVVIYAAVKVLR